jgi:hypothetical protein
MVVECVAYEVMPPQRPLVSPVLVHRPCDKNLDLSTVLSDDYIENDERVTHTKAVYSFHR